MTWYSCQPVFQFWEAGDELVHSMRCVHSIKAPVYRDRTMASNIDVISHLAINQIGLSDHEQTLETLKEILALYHYGHQQESQMINKGPDPNKPTGVFLFVGPSGVGKTEKIICVF